MKLPTADLTHRLAAILAGDAAGYSRLMAQDESGTVADLDQARAVFQAVIAAHQGRVIDMSGDSVLAAFETATGAVQAALAIQQQITASHDTHEPRRRMQFRIGVHVGEVIEKTDGSICGDGVNVAARLQTLARPGSIAVSEAIHDVVRNKVDAHFTDQGQHRLKNIDRPVRVFTVNLHGSAGISPGQLKPDGASQHQPAPESASANAVAAQHASALFIGRHQEMIELAAALASARSGRGQVMMLAGSGGMGKTRLAQQLAALAEADGVPVLWGRCLEEPGAPPYWPWRQLIRGYLRASGDPDPQRTFGPALADIASIVPDLAEGLAAPAPEASTGDSAQSRFRLFDAVVGFLRRAVQRVPLLLIFEDLHWADATSLRLLAFLAAEMHDFPLMVLGTYRDSEVSRRHTLFDTLGELARSPAYRRLELGGLSSHETEAFMRAAGNLSTGFVDAIHARTEGHPLFLQETLRFLKDGRSASDGLSSVDDAQALSLIPAGVREVIGKRLNRLALPAVNLLSIAACIGRSFDLDLLARLEPDKTEDEILTTLEDALAVQLVETNPETHQFRFSHGLIRETLYDDMLGLRRARLHLRIGNLLEERSGADDDIALPQLAYHFSEAGPGAASAKALDYARRSGERAAKLLAFEEAARLFQLALQLQKKHFPAEEHQRCSLLLRLGDIHLSLGDGASARKAFSQAAEIARAHGLSPLFAQAAIGFERTDIVAARSGEPAVALLLEAIELHHTDDLVKVELLARLCRAYVYSDRESEAKEAHRHAVALARQIGDQAGLYAALASIAAASYWPDMLHARLAAVTEAWSIAKAHNFSLPVVDCLPFFLGALINIGDAPALRRLLDQGMHIANENRAPYLLTLCRHTEALVAINEGRFDDAETWAQHALESGRRLSEDQAASVFGMQMFCLRREQGRLREALPMLEHFVRNIEQSRTWIPGLALLYAELDMREPCQAQFDSLPWHRATNAPRDVSTLTAMLFAAEVCTYLADAKHAHLLYPLLEPLAGIQLMVDFGGPCLGSADRLLGNLASVMTQWTVAQAHFERAMEMNRAAGARVWLAHTGHDYAAMLLHRETEGDAGQARTLLDEALVESSALGMAALTPRIAALIASLQTPRPAYPSGLTEREVDVLKLIAMGRNNREIGQVLAISPNTVANHVRNILEKTYTANRTEAASFANREGLL
jgi:class 3 adenylate cyclase/ATP/maltotriose-dependent transcriptional regulator MalT